MNGTGIHTPYFKNLDALRFLSFLGVFLSHTVINLPDSNLPVDFFIYLVSLNYLSVPFFFTLSSFLITYHLLKQKIKTGKIALTGFYRNRILRIWPVYYLVISICFLFIPGIASVLHSKTLSLPPLSPFLFFYANFFIIENGSGFTSALVILWSISIEEQFYLTWAPVIRFISKKWLTVFIISLFAGSILFSCHYLYIEHKRPENMAIHSIFVLQNFCTGALLAIIALYKGWLFRFLNSRSRLFWISIYLALPIICFFFRNIIALNVFKSTCFSLILFDQAVSDHSLFQAGKQAFINYLGKISYGLYVYHALVIVILHNALHFFDYGSELPKLRNAGEVAVTLIITVIIAHLSYRYFETRFLALKKNPAIHAAA